MLNEKCVCLGKNPDCYWCMGTGEVLNDYFPWDDINDSPVMSVDDLDDEIINNAIPCPICETSSKELRWIDFMSPAWTWEMLCGRGGYLSICKNCHVQVQFFLSVMN